MNAISVYVDNPVCVIGEDRERFRDRNPEHCTFARAASQQEVPPLGSPLAIRNVLIQSIKWYEAMSVVSMNKFMRRGTSHDADAFVPVRVNL